MTCQKNEKNVIISIQHNHIRWTIKRRLFSGRSGDCQTMMGKKLSDFYPKQTRSYFSGPESLCKVSSKLNQNCGHRSVYRQTDIL